MRFIAGCRAPVVVEPKAAPKGVVISPLLCVRFPCRPGVAVGEARVRACCVPHPSKRRGVDGKSRPVLRSPRGLGGGGVLVVPTRPAHPLMQALPHIGIRAPDVEHAESIAVQPARRRRDR